jgi:hypothetical protein
MLTMSVIAIPTPQNGDRQINKMQSPSVGENTQHNFYDAYSDKLTTEAYHSSAGGSPDMRTKALELNGLKASTSYMHGGRGNDQRNGIYAPSVSSNTGTLGKLPPFDVVGKTVGAAIPRIGKNI